MAAALAMLGALLVQTTLFGRLRVGGVAPDLVIMVLVLATLRLRNEQALLLAFAAGVVFDALSATAIGLRAIAYVTVVYVAIRTRERADFSPFAVAVWLALMTILGVVLFLVVGTLFAQIRVDGGEALQRLVLIPILNLVIALLLSPVIGRLLEPARRGL